MPEAAKNPIRQAFGQSANRRHHRGATYRRTEYDDTPGTVTVGTLTYAGSGWLSEGDALLVNTAASQRRRARRIGREELAHEARLMGAAA